MSVLRFVGTTNREAMRKVRDALGDDALIVANRRVDDGVEILAMAEDTASDLADKARAAGPAAAPPGESRQSAAGWPSRRQTDRALAPDATQPEALSTPQGELAADASSRLLQEIQGVRSLLVREQARRDGGDDAVGRLFRLLRSAGFCSELAEELLRSLPQELESVGVDDAALRNWLVRQLTARLQTLANEDDFFMQGGVIALVGPTGVGKTTTTAKIAARCVMTHGADQVALLSTDSFRIGAHEQLRIYAELLNVPLYALDAEQPLAEVLSELRSRKLVLVDTVGTSQRDQRVIEQIGRLQQGPVPVRTVLVLNAAAQPETLDEVIASYTSAARASGTTLRDCILTKHDEASRLAPVLDRIISQSLQLLFVSHGQRVPEDLALADAPTLVIQALQGADHTKVDDAVAGGQSRRPQWSQRLLSQGRRVGLTLRTLQEQVAGFNELLAAWDITALSESAQRNAADRLLHTLPVERGHGISGILWSRRTSVAGAAAPFPDLWLDENGHWICWPALQHRQPAGQTERLRWATAQGGANVHLLPGLPDPLAWDWLMRQGFPWVCQVRGTQRVYLNDQRVDMAALTEHTDPVGKADCVVRGQPAQLAVGRVAVLAAPQAKGRTPQRFAVRAWVGRLRSRETGTELGMRYWLTPRVIADNGLLLLLSQLAAEALPGLTRRLHQKLADALPDHARSELRWLLASGLAVCATRIATDRTEVGMDLRADLLGLLGVRSGASPARLGEALLYLCAGRDTLHALASDDRGGGRR